MEIDIVAVVSAEGIDLKRRGRLFWGSCPFHAEKKPSFSVNPDRGRYNCYGCGARGDAIDFIRELKKLSFADAKRYLSVGGTHPKAGRQNRSLRSFRRWKRAYKGYLVDLYRTLTARVRRIRSFRTMANKAYLYHALSLVERRLDIIENGPEEAVRELYNWLRKGDYRDRKRLSTGLPHHVNRGHSG
jgi:hypothetical protein